MKFVYLEKEDREIIREAIINSEEFKSQAEFAREVLFIHRNSLARKLSGSRPFSALEISLINANLNLNIKKM